MWACDLPKPATLPKSTFIGYTSYYNYSIYIIGSVTPFLASKKYLHFISFSKHTCDWNMFLWCPLEDKADTHKIAWLIVLAIFMQLSIGAVNLYQNNNISQKSLTGTTVKNKTFLWIILRIFRKPVKCSQMSHLFPLPGQSYFNKCALHMKFAHQPFRPQMYFL